MMRRHPKTTGIVVLTLLLLAVQPCPAQTATPDKTADAQADEAKFDAPENDMKLIQSEWAARINATRKAMPEFPEEALKARAQGLVVLSLYQDGAGNAANIKVIKSPHPALTRAAIAAAEQWTWRRFVSGGIPRPILSKLSFKFIIEGGAGRVEDPPDDEDFRNLRDIRALRLKANWPDEKSRPAKQGGSD